MNQIIGRFFYVGYIVLVFINNGTQTWLFILGTILVFWTNNNNFINIYIYICITLYTSKNIERIYIKADNYRNTLDHKPVQIIIWFIEKTSLQSGIQFRLQSEYNVDYSLDYSLDYRRVY